MQPSKEIGLGRQLAALTWPMIIGTVSMMGFQLVDSAFIAQLGVVPLAVQGFTMPPQMVIIGVQVGFGISITAIVSRVIGEKQTDQARSLAGLILLLCMLTMSALCVFLYSKREYLLAFMGASDDAIIMAGSYWLWWLASTWLGAMLYCLYSICRANGNTKLPGMMMVFTSLLNLVLDPIFIFVLDYGINGAAMATIAAFIIGWFVVLPKILRLTWVSFNFSRLNIKRRLLQITHIMGPAMIGQLLPAISALAATRFVANYGESAVGAWALAVRYEFFAIVVVLALSMSMPPMVGRMFGAGEFGNIKRLVWVTLKFVFVFQTAIAVLTWFTAPWIASVAASDPEVKATLVYALRTLPFAYAALGTAIVLVSVSNAMAKSVLALVISGARLFLFFLPAVWLGSVVYGLTGIFWGALVGNLFAGLFAYFLYRRSIYRLLDTDA